jgi:lipopolysaccharide/colanic/teichoic acid biosynthesis glycosyltransferase
MNRRRLNEAPVGTAAPSAGTGPFHARAVVDAHPASPIGPAARVVKRTLDVVGALVGLLLSAPLFLYVAIRIKRDSSGPVFFWQTRLTQNQRPFTMIKFRTMRADASEDDHREYIEHTMSGSARQNGNGLYKLDRDEDVTRFGRWLRETSLDEIPQFINVLRGDMSLVGPRPCLAYETPYFELHHMERFRVPAGMTGLWQVRHRARADFREALELDVQYVRAFSLLQDLKLIALTIPSILRKERTV